MAGKQVWRKIFVGEEVPLNELSAEDTVTLKNMSIHSLKVRVDLPREEVEDLPLLANKYNHLSPYPPDLLDKCMIVGTYGSKEEQEADKQSGYKVFDFSYKSETKFIK